MHAAMSARAAKLAGLSASRAGAVGAAAPGPSFRDFVLRSQVLQQYAAFQRALMRAGLWRRADLRGELRAAFRKTGANGGDFAARRARLDEGAQTLSTLRRQLGVLHASSASSVNRSTLFAEDGASAAAAAAAGSGMNNEAPGVAQLISERATPSVETSGAALAQEDSRFRIGTGWPWS